MTNNYTDKLEELDEILLKAFNDFYDYVYEPNIVKAAEEYSNKTIYRDIKTALTALINRDYITKVEHAARMSILDQKIVSLQSEILLLKLGLKK
jgi:hypothetical protein